MSGHIALTCTRGRIKLNVLEFNNALREASRSASLGTGMPTFLQMASGFSVNDATILVASHCQQQHHPTSVSEAESEIVECCIR